MEKKIFKLDVGGEELSIEVSRLAEQANAAVIAKYGETIVLVTAVMSKKDATVDYLPLKVDYEEKFYAARKVLGSRYVRREGKSSEEAVLTGRLVDRTIRPLFDWRLRRDVQVVVTVLSYDEEHDPDFPGLVGASTALAMSDIPWNGPVAGLHVAKIAGEFVVNPTNTKSRGEALFDTFVAGSEGKINMIELGGKEVPEADIIKAFGIAQKEIDKLIEFQRKIVKEIGKSKAEVALYHIDPSLKEHCEKFLTDKLEDAVYVKDKMEFNHRLSELHKALYGDVATVFKEPNYKAVDMIFDEAINDVVHKNILEKEKRPDGRKLDEVRPLEAEVGLFRRTHGSAVFMRGNTQSLAVTTLAAPGQEQLIETMETTGKRRFLLHYNFPPYSVGEIGPFRGPGRREIGHGALAEKALKPFIPTAEEFPYTVRVVSEILSSNGSSSMATTCASSLSMMDAGVPLKKPVAGIAMGLMMSDVNNYKVLTDIQGPEDHHGDMDFKVAGTDAGVSAMQMDVKVDGVTLEILEKGLEQARKARLEILKVMNATLSAPRPKISEFAPGIIQIKINPEKIGTVIGPGGKMINGLIKKYELETIDIEEDGSVFIASRNMDRAEAAREEIKALTREFAVGDVVEGNIIKIMDFGAIVDLGGGRDGMVHVSELKEGYVKNVTDAVKLGDFVRAKIIRVEDDRIGLSMKQLKG